MSLPSPTKSDAVVERSWRPISVSAGLTDRRRRLLWFGAAVLAFLLLFYWLVRRPIQEPQVHLVGLPAPGESFDSRWTVRATQETLDSQTLRTGLEELRQQLSGGKWADSGRNNELTFSAPPDAPRLLEQLQGISRASSDVLILFINTQAVNRDGQLYFSWDRSREPDGRWWDARELFQALRSHPAALKLVVLDAGQTQWAPQQGIVINDFLSVLRSRLRETRDSSLWFLCSHASGEISHLDHQRNSSLFNLAVLQGMQGDADLDANGTISVRELTQFTVFKVDAWSQQYAGYQFRQTPQILWGGGDLEVASHWPDLIPVVVASSEEEADEPPPPPAAKPSPAKPDEAAKPQSGVASVLDNPLRLFAFRFRTGPLTTGGFPPLGMILQTPVAPDAPSPAATAPVPATGPPAASASPSATSEAAPQSSASAPTTTPNLSGPAPAKPAPAAGKSEEKERELTPSEKALAAAWTIHDRLRNLESAANWTAASRFPLEFRRLQHELIRLEFLSRSLSDADRAGWDRQVERIVSRFTTMEAELSRPLPLPTESEPIRRLIEDQPLHSLALARLLPTDNDKLARVDASLTGLAQAFAQDKLEAQQTFAAELQPDRRLIEVELACRLAELPPSVSGAIKQTALRNRIRLEHLAARAFGLRTWIDDRFRAAELALSRSEAIVLNRIPGTLGGDVEHLLDSVAFDIDGLAATLATVSEADRLTSHMSARLGDYIPLSRLSGDSEAGFAPTPGELSEIVGLLSAIQDALQAPDPAQIPQLARDVQKLHAAERLIRNRIAESVRQLTETSRANAAQLGWRREVLLRVPLVSSADRQRLWESLATVSPTGIDGDMTEFHSLAGLVAPALSPRTVDALNSHIALQLQLSQLALAVSAPSVAELQSLQTSAELDPSWSDETLLVSYADVARQLEELYAQAHEKMLGEVPPELTDLNPQLTASRLRGWSEFSRLLSPAVAGRKSELEPAALLVSASLRDLLVWQVERLERQRSGSAILTSNEVAAAERGYRRALRSIWPAYPAADESRPSIELLVPDSLMLSRTESPTLKLVCRNHLPHAIRGVLVLEHDNETVAARVISPALEPARADAEQGLVDGALFSKSSQMWSLSVEPNGTQVIELALECTTRRCRFTPVAMTWIGRVSDPAAGPQEITFAQRTIRLEHPFAESWTLSLRDGQTIGKNGGLVLQPFPNRETPYALQLDYVGDESIEVDVVLANSAAESPVPDAETVMLNQNGLAFSFDSPSAPLTWSAGRPTGTAPVATDGAKVATPPVARPIGSRLELRIADRRSGRTATIPVWLQTQRPRRYLKPSVSYDRDREVVRVIVEPRPEIPRPAGPIAIACRLAAAPDAKSKPVEATATLLPTAARQELTLRLPAQIDGRHELSIAVDGIEREFLYQVPTDQSITHLPEVLDRSRLAIVSPPPGAAFMLPGDSIPLKLEVDLPVADRLANTPSPIAAVWLDAVSNESWDPSEPVVRIDTDRDVQLQLQSPDESGRFKIITSVKDWQLNLPGSGLPEGHVELRGELQTSLGTHSSSPVGIILDGTGPVLASNSPNLIAEKAPFPIAVSLAEEDASGLARVDAQIDLQGDGRFLSDAPVIKGVRVEPSGDWRCLVPTQDLTPGRYTVLLQGYDAVGNASEILSQSMVIVSAEQMTALTQGDAVPVTGVVVFGKDPVAEVTVTLSRGAPATVPQAPAAAAANKGPAPMTVKTDKTGRFRFENVPPGEWTLKARVLLLNRYRIHEEAIRVEPPPASSGIHRIRLK